MGFWDSRQDVCAAMNATASKPVPIPSGKSSGSATCRQRLPEHPTLGLNAHAAAILPVLDVSHPEAGMREGHGHRAEAWHGGEGHAFTHWPGSIKLLQPTSGVPIPKIWRQGREDPGGERSRGQLE